MSIKNYSTLSQLAHNWRHFNADTGSAENFSVWNGYFDPSCQPGPGRHLNGHVLIVPGRNEHAIKYTEVADEWASRGFRAVCINPNHDVTSFDSYKDEFNSIFNGPWQFLTKGHNKPAIIQAHSTGAHVAARCLATGNAEIEGADALIMSAPLVALSPVPLLPPRLMFGIITAMGKVAPQKFASDVDEWNFNKNTQTSDPDRYRLMQDIALNHPTIAPRGAKWGWVSAAQRSCRALESEIPKLQLPHLLLATPNDKVVSGVAQDKFVKAQRLRLPESRHEVFMEQDRIRGLAWQAIDGFLEDVVTAKANRTASRETSSRLGPS